MENGDLEEGEIFDDLPDNINSKEIECQKSSSPTKPESGFWVKMTKISQEKMYKTNKRNREDLTHPFNRHQNGNKCVSKNYSSNKNSQNKNGVLYECRQQNDTQQFGDIDERQFYYRKGTDFELVNGENDEELSELQLRLEALQSTMQNCANPSPSKLDKPDKSGNSDVLLSECPPPSVVSKNKLKKKKRRKKRKHPKASSYENFNSVQFGQKNLQPHSAAEWNRIQGEKILSLSDPREQYNQFISMVLTPRSEVEKLSAATTMSSSTSSFFNSENTSYTDGPTSTMDQTREDYSLTNMDLDTDESRPSSRDQQVVNVQASSKMLPSQNELKNAISCWRPMQISDRDNNPSLPSLKLDCKDEDEVFIVKCDSSTTNTDENLAEEINDVCEILEKEPKKVELVVIDDEDDDETSALREILLKSLQSKSISKPKKIVQTISHSASDNRFSVPDQQHVAKFTAIKTVPSSVPVPKAIVPKVNDVFVTVGGNGRRNVVTIGRSASNPNMNPVYQNTSNKSRSNNWSRTADSRRLIVSRPVANSSYRTVTAASNEKAISRTIVNIAQTNLLRKQHVVINHKPVIIPLDEDSDDEDPPFITNFPPLSAASVSSVPVFSSSSNYLFNDETVLNECLKSARQKADVIRLNEYKRRQKMEIVKMEQSLKKCRNDLRKHKATLSEDRTRLRTLESIAIKRKTDLRLAEMKVQKLREELRNVEQECSSHRAFILRVNVEIQSVQSRCDRSLELQNVYQKQWNEIQQLVDKHRNIIEKRVGNKHSLPSSVAPDVNQMHLVHRKTSSESNQLQSANPTVSSSSNKSSVKAAAACLKRAMKRRSSELSNGSALPFKQQKLFTSITTDLQNDSKNTSGNSSSSGLFGFLSIESTGANSRLNEILNIQDEKALCSKDAGGQDVEKSVTNFEEKYLFHCPQRAEEFSDLLCFRSYRLSKQFLAFASNSNVSLSSLTFCNKIRPNVRFCPFALNGTCFDSTCKWQHECDFKLSEVESIADLLSYCPTMVNGFTDGDSIIKCAEQLYSNLKEEMPFEEILNQCVLKISEERRSVGSDVILEPRLWKPSQIANNAQGFMAVRAPSYFKRNSSVPSSCDCSVGLNSDVLDSSNLRYFTPNFEMESENSSGDIDFWIRMSSSALNDYSVGPLERDVKALKILCKALDKNREDVRLWLNYLSLYKRQAGVNVENLHKLIGSILKFAQSFEIYWLLWDTCRTFDENLDCFEKCLNYLLTLTSPRVAVDENTVVSGHVFRTLGRMVVFCLKDNKLSKAKYYLKHYLTKILNGFDSLLKCRALLFTLYIYLEHFGELISTLEFHVFNDHSFETIEVDFAISWQLDRLKDEKNVIALYEIFSEAFENCAPVKCSQMEAVKNLWILHINRINLDCLLGRFVDACNYCDKLMELCGPPDCQNFGDLLIISKQCRLFMS